MTKLEKSREKLVKLIAERPDACAALVRALSKSEEGLIKLSFCFDSLGYAHARVLFQDILEEEWPTLERLTKPWSRKLTNSQHYKGLITLYLEFFSHCLSWSSDRIDEKGSLAFLREMKRSKLEKLLADQLPTDVAILSTVMTPFEFSSICEALPESDRRQVAVTKGRLARLPAGVVAEQAMSYLEQLRNEVNKEYLAKAQAEAGIRKAMSGIDLRRNSVLLDLIQQEMPTLNHILNENGYFKAAKELEIKLAESLAPSSHEGETE